MPPITIAAIWKGLGSDRPGQGIELIYAGGARKSRLVAVDSNVLLDLASDNEMVIDALRQCGHLRIFSILRYRHEGRPKNNPQVPAPALRKTEILRPDPRTRPPKSALRSSPSERALDRIPIQELCLALSHSGTAAIQKRFLLI